MMQNKSGLIFIGMQGNTFSRLNTRKYIHKFKDMQLSFHSKIISIEAFCVQSSHMRKLWYSHRWSKESVTTKVFIFSNMNWSNGLSPQVLYSLQWHHSCQVISNNQKPNCLFNLFRQETKKIYIKITTFVRGIQMWTSLTKHQWCLKCLHAMMSRPQWPHRVVSGYLSIRTYASCEPMRA